MKLPFCCLAALFLTAGAHAGTVICTDSAHPVTSRAYSGFNGPLLWMAAEEYGYMSDR